MAKYNRAARIRAARRWYKNVGDPINLAKQSQPNPNDYPEESKKGLKKV